MNLGLKAIASYAAGKSLRGRCQRGEIRVIVADAAHDYDAQSRALPQEESLAGKLMLRLAATTIAFYRALQRRGFGPEEARERTARGTWAVYEKMAAIPWALSRNARTSLARLERCISLFRRFPFGSPAYEIVDVRSDDEVIAFDVRRCPVAEYFSKHGLEGLCVQSFCNLDFPLAKEWSATLERTGTLVEGAPCCDFRWRATPFATGGET